MEGRAGAPRDRTEKPVLIRDTEEQLEELRPLYSFGYLGLTLNCLLFILSHLKIGIC